MFKRNGTNWYHGSFVIDGISPVDDAEETDGLELCFRPLGSRFQNGMLVVQDGFSDENENRQASILNMFI